MHTLYQRLLADRFALLHPRLQAFLGADGAKRTSGPMQVVRGRGWSRNLVAALLGIPRAGRYETHLEVLPCAGGERWLRRFGSCVLQTRQRAWRGLLLESSGPGSLGFELLVRDGGLFFHCRRAWMLGLPIPLWLAPRIDADNKPAGEGWTVSVRFRVAGLGEVARYEGEMRPAGEFI